MNPVRLVRMGKLWFAGTTVSMGVLAMGVLAMSMTLGACGGGNNPQPTTGGGAFDTNVEPTRVLVRPAAGEDVTEIADGTGSTAIKEVPKTNFFVVEFPDSDTANDFIDQIEGDTRVLDRELDRIVSAPEGGGATLPAGEELFDFAVVQDQPELLRIGAMEARSRATGAGVRVAVIDSGVVMTHVAMQGKIEPGGWDFVDDDDDPSDVMNGVDDDNDGYIDEGFGHGTFVSSLILALAPNAQILPYRVLNSDNVGLTSHVAEAITRATDAGVDVINLSLGMEHQAYVVGQAIAYARDNAVLVIASAGNTGNQEITFPATIGIALSVTSGDPGDIKCDFASYGESVDVAAPGFELLGAYPVEDDKACKWSGTSFSAAIVTGCYALVRELELASGPGGQSEVVQAIQQGADEFMLFLNPEYEGLLGHGRLDLDAATQPTPP